MVAACRPPVAPEATMTSFSGRSGGRIAELLIGNGLAQTCDAIAAGVDIVALWMARMAAS